MTTSGAGKPQAKKRKPNKGSFVKGDPRINRKGTIKPRAQRELEELLDEIFDEEIEITENGKKQKMTQLKAGLIGLWRNKNITGRINLVERRFGKIPQPVTGTGEGGAFVVENNTSPEQIAQRVAYLLEVAKKRKDAD
jgi:hypothetical protein